MCWQSQPLQLYDGCGSPARICLEFSHARGIMSKFGKYILNTKLKCPPIGDARHPQLYQLLVHASFDDWQSLFTSLVSSLHHKNPHWSQRTPPLHAPSAVSFYRGPTSTPARFTGPRLGQEHTWHSGLGTKAPRTHILINIILVLGPYIFQYWIGITFGNKCHTTSQITQMFNTRFYLNWYEWMIFHLNKWYFG